MGLNMKEKLFSLLVKNGSYVFWGCTGVLTIVLGMILKFSSLYPHFQDYMAMLDRTSEIGFITISLLIVCFLPGLVIQTLLKKQHDWIISCVLSLFFIYVLGYLLNVFRIFNYWIVIPVYFSMIPLLIYYQIKRIGRLSFQDIGNCFYSIKWKSVIKVIGEIVILFFIFKYVALKTYLVFLNDITSLYAGDPITIASKIHLIKDQFPLLMDNMGHPNYYPPLYSLIAVASVLISGVTVDSYISGANLFWGLLYIGLAYYAFRKILGRKQGFIALFLFSLLLLDAIYPFQALPSAISRTFIVLCFYLFSKAFEDYYYLMIAGLAVGLVSVLYVQGAMLIMCAFVLFLLFYLSRKHDVRSLLWAFSSLLTMGCLFLSYWYFYVHIAGIKPAAGGWLQDEQWKTPPFEFKSWADTWNLIVKPVYLELFTIAVGYLASKKTKNYYLWSSFVSLFSVCLVLRWHHIFTEPLLGFSVQPHRFSGFTPTFTVLSLILLVQFSIDILSDLRFVGEKSETYRPIHSPLIVSLVIISIFQGYMVLNMFDKSLKYRKEILNHESVYQKQWKDEQFSENRWIGSWIDKNIPKTSKILGAPWDTSYYVTAMAGRLVFMGHPGGYGPMDDTFNKHYKLTKKAFQATDTNISSQIFIKNHIRYIFQSGVFNDVKDDVYRFEGPVFKSNKIHPIFGAGKDIIVWEVNTTQTVKDVDYAVYIQDTSYRAFWNDLFNQSLLSPKVFNPKSDVVNKNLLIAGITKFSGQQTASLLDYLENGGKAYIQGGDALSVVNTILEHQGHSTINRLKLRVDRLIPVVIRNNHYLTQDAPEYLPGLFTPLCDMYSKTTSYYEVFDNREMLFKPIMSLDGYDDCFLLGSLKIGKGELIISGCNLNEGDNFIKYSITHRLNEYLSSGESHPAYIPLDDPVKKTRVSLLACQKKNDNQMYSGVYSDHSSRAVAIVGKDVNNYLDYYRADVDGDDGYFEFPVVKGTDNRSMQLSTVRKGKKYFEYVYSGSTNVSNLSEMTFTQLVNKKHLDKDLKSSLWKKYNSSYTIGVDEINKMYAYLQGTLSTNSSLMDYYARKKAGKPVEEISLKDNGIKDYMNLALTKNITGLTYHANLDDLYNDPIYLSKNTCVQVEYNFAVPVYMESVEFAIRNFAPQYAGMASTAIILSLDSTVGKDKVMVIRNLGNYGAGEPRIVSGDINTFVKNVKIIFYTYKDLPGTISDIKLNFSISSFNFPYFAEESNLKSGYKCGINFGKYLSLIGYDLRPGTVNPGGKVHMKYYWKVLDPEIQNKNILLTLSVRQIDGKSENVIATERWYLCNGEVDFTKVSPDIVVKDTDLYLDIDPQAKKGIYGVMFSIKDLDNDIDLPAENFGPNKKTKILNTAPNSYLSILDKIIVAPKKK